MFILCFLRNKKILSLNNEFGYSKNSVLLCVTIFSLYQKKYMKISNQTMFDLFLNLLSQKPIQKLFVWIFFFF